MGKLLKNCIKCLNFTIFGMSQQYLDLAEKALKLGDYSEETIKAYLFQLRDYFNTKKTAPEILDQVFLEKYLLDKKIAGWSAQTMNLSLNAIKFFYKKVIGNLEKITIKLANVSHKLPVILTRAEIAQVLSGITNFKHYLITALAYGSGLHLSEVVNLRVADLDFTNCTIRFSQGKDKEDRLTIFPRKISSDLQSLIAGKGFNDFVFTNEQGSKLTPRTIQKFFASALKKAGIENGVTFNSLRHTFATHLLENGTDLHYVKRLLGHVNVRTTQIYLNVAKSGLKNISSPLI